MKINAALCYSFVALRLFIISTGYSQIKWIESSDSLPWQIKTAILTPADNKNTRAEIIPVEKLQTVDGFGVCFNELGWTALSGLEKQDRETVLRNLFDNHEGLGLRICRMPIGANDYARDYYSLNDSAGDFKMKYFSIERDKEMLIPYIKAAMKYQPDLKIWASPWTPPAWMKKNRHYACHPDKVNDMRPDQEGHEGYTQFIMEPDYLEAYALYFSKFLQVYRNEGIPITGIHVQNEMNSCQNFPSCIWSAKDLGTFIGSYLGPKLKSSVPWAEVWYGTYERPGVEKIDTILKDSRVIPYITGISFQWAGKEAIAGVHLKYPQMKLMQSETECGNGSNDWMAAEYTFSLMKHYFSQGISVYTFWNSVLDESGKSMWGWKQNSMISIDSESGKITYNPEYYLLKHFSAFILPGAARVTIKGEDEGLLAFLNTDESVILIAGNTKNEARNLRIRIGNKILQAELKGHTFNTFVIPK